MATSTHNGMNTEAHLNHADAEFRTLPNPMIDDDASPFFRAAGAQLEAASRARTADELIQLLNSVPGACAPSAGDAFIQDARATTSWTNSCKDGKSTTSKPRTSGKRPPQTGAALNTSKATYERFEKSLKVVALMNARY
ncbi:hypothetical protein NQ042_12585 [Corynebacterium phoceense]|uniref:hypothetical protein n=1 Tax=Corynebacterium phoceense TaxID=1686286 RepID=UPI00211C0768|nr:hypothetical protein [Corynebacterium phoceense]MCQ9334901.1 hypothetical protein [Corynebacterium phoceense]